MSAANAPVILITGASSGIGEATARLLVKGGARVVLAARRLERLQALRQEIDPSGETTDAVACDITKDEDRRALVARALQRFGRLDVLVNNAGYGLRGPLEIVSVEDVRRNFETNVFSLIALTQLVLPHFRQQQSGRIINIGSVAGRIARPLSSVYDSTKHALEALTDGLRGELKPWNIHVSLVRPGFIVTEFIEAANAASEATLQNAGPYAPYYAGHKAKSANLRRVAGVPDDIARLIRHAALSPKPRSHYSGPFHAKVFLLLKTLLPTFVLDRVLGMKRAG